jgi:hypothetical protein
MERVPDFFDAIRACDDGDARMTAQRFAEATDLASFKAVTDFWRSVDDRLGIPYEASPITI